jgi:DNA-directed RNA polymerase omega subunit
MMANVHVPLEGEAAEPAERTQAAGLGEGFESPRAVAQPIASRFLFVDVSAQRAKQLRRGAVPRVAMPEAHKLERIAMREVSSGYVEWTLPAFRGAGASVNADAKPEAS